jgi:uncharacterized membrane protein
MPQTMHVLALAGALCSAAATIFIRQGLRTSDPFSGFWINLLVGTISLWVAVLVTGGSGRVSARAALFFDRRRADQPRSLRLFDPGHRAAR